MTHYDLHCHSTASDGALSPKALVERAVQQG
ncbi:MAG TPA: phosphatase, partial [Methylophaga sp.]|nr:phosphatase [Methylophaga sp.]